MIEVVTSGVNGAVCVDVGVDVVEVAVGVGVGVGTAPGVSMCPANTDTASVRLRMVAALIRRNVFTLGAS